MPACITRIHLALPLALLAALLPTTRAQAAPQSAAAVDESFVDIGPSARILPRQTVPSDLLGSSGLLLAGFTLGGGHRLTEAVVLNVQSDVLWSDEHLSVGARTGALLDFEWDVSPVIGPWLGFRYGRGSFDHETSSFNLGPRLPTKRYAGRTGGQDLSLGLDAGVRARHGRFIATLAFQGAVALWSKRWTSYTTAHTEDPVDPISTGDYSELGVVARVGARW